MRLLIAFSLTAIAVTPLHAQVPPPAVAAPEGHERRAQLFIAPSGKPFRAPPGNPYPVALWFAEADANHDGKLTMSELRDDAARFFAELDANHDGEIDPDEVRRYETVIAPEIQIGGFGGGERPGGMSGGAGRHGGGHRGGGGGSGGGGHRGGGGDAGGGGGSESGSSGERPQATLGSNRGAGRYGLIDTPEPVSAADTDLDRSITLAEFKAKAISDFQELDAAGRGYLTLADLPTAAAELHPGNPNSRGRHRSGR